jgi:hypothetical protein
MIIYQIHLPKTQNAETFVTFMQEEYFPAIHKGATRVGLVTDLVLLQSDNPGTDHEFFWHVGWSGLSEGGPHVDNKEVQQKFEAFNPRLKRLGSYNEAAAWHKNETS